jgi:hypothetical protein
VLELLALAFFLAYAKNSAGLAEPLQYKQASENKTARITCAYANPII